MTTNASYVTYQCDTCNRQKEIQLDARRPDPVRCNITLNCNGKLKRVSTHDNKTLLFTPPVQGLADYYPRGTTQVQQVATTELQQISLLTTKQGPGLTMAFLYKRATINGNEFYTRSASGQEVVVERQATSQIPLKTTAQLVMYELQPELIKFKKYSYQVSGSVQSVRGSDDSPDKNNLYFTVDNRVRVYVNGIELSASQFDRTVLNEITFTPIITTTSNLIEILVYNDISSTFTEDKLFRLNFSALSTTVSADLLRRENFCWGDTISVTTLGDNRFCFFCDDFSLLSSERSYGLARVEVTSSSGAVTIVDPREAFILLGRQPFATSDKEFFAYAATSDLVDDVVFSYHRNAGVLEFTVADSEITQTVEPLQQAVKVAITESSTPLVSPKGTTALKRKYTLGPT